MIDISFFWLLSLALFYLLFTSIIFIRNRFDLTSLTFSKQNDDSDLKISVCIPARNEENTISTLLRSLTHQQYSNFDIHVLDDQSEDNTPNILKTFQELNPKNFYIHRGKKKPGNWYGKPWACHQLGNIADGDILLFLDADTKLLPGAIEKVRNSFEEYKIDMLTVWPQQKLGTFWEKTVIPLIYYGLITILPAIYVYRRPKWMSPPLYQLFSSRFAAANGQCIAFKKDAYEKIGGHSSVKKEIVEDVELAKNAKKMGLTLRMFHGVGTVSCRMYESNREMFNGLRKNFLAGFGNSIGFFITAACLHLIVFILPYVVLIWSFYTGNSSLFFLSVACIAITLLHRLALSLWFRWDPIYAFTHPLGVLWFQWLGLIKLFDFKKGKKTSWKGREV
jgi:chlorobactene glucosyltransferase